MHRVAITGIGIVSTLGFTREAVARALYDGVSGIGFDLQRQEKGFLSPLTGVIQDFEPVFPLSRKQRKTLPIFAEWAVEAAFQALAHAGLEACDFHNEASGVIFGCDSSCIAAIEQVEALAQNRSTSSLGSGQVFRSMTSCISMNLGVLLQAQGACWTLSGACASGGHSIGQAADLIRCGRQERIVCGGAQEINWQSMCSFDGLGAFASRINTPTTASRPFDAGRDGLVPSGGAAAVLLERYDVAQQRGATIYGELLGYGFSADGDSIAVPSRTGIGRAMRQAMGQAALTCQDISYICAHATSTPAGDRMEALNIIDLFNGCPVPVSSTKALTGHELWMSGAAQVVYTCLMAQHGFTAANHNYEEGDEVTASLQVLRTRLESPPTVALCNAAGFGGTNSCLALRFSA